MTATEEILSNLPNVATVTLLVVFALIVLQEAVNGFHDTANAVATVIYSNAMRPAQAVWLSAFLNFLGVLLGGTAVAFGLVFLLPKEMVAGINTPNEAALMLALVLSAIAWNLTTWWFGIPNSTTHTYIGSVIGVSMAHAALTGTSMIEAMNWPQSEKILVTLLISPIFGFALAWLLYKGVKRWSRDTRMFEPHQPGVVPPGTIRAPLIGGLIGVSFLHGSNDGQKSIGLMLMTLMGLAPGLYAVDPVKDQASYRLTLEVIEEIEDSVAAHVDDPRLPNAAVFLREIEHLKDVAHRDWQERPISAEEKIRFRKEILDVHEALGRVIDSSRKLDVFDGEERRKLRHAHRETTRLIEDVPFWLIVVSAVALGTGTMIGYRRITRTLGEKMGDKPMSPAQGLSTQMAAMAAIAAADGGGVPVSTTHVLTAGVAGSVQSAGDRIQWVMIRRILITWVTTLPGTVLLSFVLGLVLHGIFA
jgi:phosphate/sulfate permease